jgi:Polyketide cyclase / dehydrase and lipid transport
MLSIILLIVAVAIMGVLIAAARKPSEFTTHRSTRVNAAPDQIFPHVNDLHRWAAWSPFEKLDPAMKKTYSGAASGQGAIYEWEGNSKAGKGRMEITRTTEPSEVVIKLDFIKPFEGHNVTTFTMKPAASGTDVTWAMAGPLTFTGKLFHVFVNMDRMLGKDFEAGLASLKAVSESSTAS